MNPQSTSDRGGGGGASFNSASPRRVKLLMNRTIGSMREGCVYDVDADYAALLLLEEIACRCESSASVSIQNKAMDPRRILKGGLDG